jgi:predicted nucleotide-binding protein (sugar kinase/HSP70/actin superfamily)
VYSVVERVIERSATPYFCFKDLDENKPIASIKLRIETIDYFLRSHRKDMRVKNQIPPVETERDVSVREGQIALNVLNAN